MEYCQAALCPPHPANLGEALYILEKWKQLCENTCVFSFLLAAFLTTFIPLVHLLFLSFNNTPLQPPTIIPASPPLPYKWVEANLSLLCGCVLRQVRPLLKQLRWTRFLCCFWKPCQTFFLFYFDCIERLHYPPSPKPPTHPNTHTHNPELLHALRGLEFQGLFLLWCLREQTNAGQGQLCTHPGKKLV